MPVLPKKAKIKKCPTCGGTGRQEKYNKKGQRYHVECERCKGQGYVSER